VELVVGRNLSEYLGVAAAEYPATRSLWNNKMIGIGTGLGQRSSRIATVLQHEPSQCRCFMVAQRCRLGAGDREKTSTKTWTKKSRDMGLHPPIKTRLGSFHGTPLTCSVGQGFSPEVKTRRIESKNRQTQTMGLGPNCGHVPCARGKSFVTVVISTGSH